MWLLLLLILSISSPAYSSVYGDYESKSSSGGLSSLCVEDEGVSKGCTASTFDFTGSAVSAVVTGDTATINITGAGGGASSNSFETMNVPAGTDPVAESSTDTLNITETSPLVITGTAGTDTVDITWDTLTVAEGGTGATSLTDGGILLGSGTGAITPLGVATNGQIPIGDGTTDPVLATITGTANEVTVTNGAGTITLDLPLNAGTDISADLEEEVTEGSLANDTILEADLKAVDSAVDEECLTYETTTGDFEWQTCGGGSDTNAVKEYWWPASATLPLSPDDSIPPITKITGANVDVLVNSFDDSTDECRTGHLKVPSDVDTSASAIFRNVWFSQTATTNSVVWDWRCQNNGVDGVTFDTVTILTEATCDTAGTVNQRDVCTATVGISALGWSANEDVACLFCRNANVSADNMVGDAELYGTSVEIPRA